MRDKTIRNDCLDFSDVSCIQAKILYRKTLPRMCFARGNPFFQQFIQNHAIIPICGCYDD